MITAATLSTVAGAEMVVAAAVGLGYSAWMFWKKLKEIREQKSLTKQPRSDQSEILSLMAKEREIALSQRDQAQALSENLREVNQTLRNEMREFQIEIEGLKNKISLLSELNRRLSVSLDSAQMEIGRITQTLSQIPSIHQGLHDASSPEEEPKST